jgi:hypothetical protein
MGAGKPLKVYILAGQSNMEGQAKIETFDYISDDPATATLLKEMRGPDGKPRVCERVWISYLTGSPDKGTLGEGFGKLTAGYGSRSNPAEDGGKMTREEQQAYVREYRARLITHEEDSFWRRAASNQGYHYFGSAKTLGQIGQAFAEALLEIK